MELTALLYTPSIKESMFSKNIDRNLTGLAFSAAAITLPLTEHSKQKQLSWSEGQVGRLHSGICSQHISALQSTQTRYV